MASLTVDDIKQISRVKKDVGLQILTGGFHWPEFCDERRLLHQEFVYEVAMVAADCGFSWPDVIQAAIFAKNFFPQLKDFALHRVPAVLKETLQLNLPHLTSVHQHQFAQILINTCTKQRLFQAVLERKVEESVGELRLNLQLPPIPHPLEQGVDVLEWESLRLLETSVIYEPQTYSDQSGASGSLKAGRHGQAELGEQLKSQQAAAGGRSNAPPAKKPPAAGKQQTQKAKTGSGGSKKAK